jgi:hypothetical protein
MLEWTSVPLPNTSVLCEVVAGIVILTVC